MQRIKYLSILALFLAAPFYGEEKPKVIPSSEIPAKREFPVNPDISPCDDFYGYACTKVVESFKLRDDRSKHIFSFSDSAERMLDKKKAFLKGLAKKKNKSKRSTDLSAIYSACMNTEAKKKEEKEWVAAILHKVKGIKTLAEFENYLADQMYLGEDYSFIDFGLIPNQDEPSQYDIYFLSDLLTLPERTYYDKDDVVSDLSSLVKDFFTSAGEPNAEGRANAVIGFEKEASKTHLLPVELRDRVAMKTQISKEDFLKKWPSFQFNHLFSNIPKNTLLRNLSPENFDWVEGALKRVPLDVLKDAYLYHTLSSYMDEAYPEFFQKKFEFEAKHLGGPAKRPELEERCAKFVMRKSGMEIDAELLPVLFPKFPTERVIATAEKVRTAIMDGIKSSDWLSEGARKVAINKMKVARLHLVKPMKEKDWDFNLPATYSATQHYKNTRTLQHMNRKKDLENLKKPRNPDLWGMSPLEINAYYSPADNKFVLPIGILQYPFFDSSLSDEANFGAMGAVVGHELGHGIDDKGSKYDEKGRLVRWMTEPDLAAFSSKGTKIIKQLDDKDMPGALKLGEFIGDLTGVTFAYHAAFPKKEVDNEKRKAFFLQYGRLWCYVARPKMMEMLAKVDPHPPGDVRVNDVLMHIPQFAEAYSCKEGSKMSLSAQDRVKIW